MAAGGVDVLRRKDSRFPRKDFGHRENGSRVQFGVNHNDDWDSRQNRSHGRTEDRDFGRFSTSKDREAARHKDNKVQLPSEKKRKFSPIIWEEKDVRVSYKKRVAAVTPPSSDTVSEATLLQPEPLLVEALVAEEPLEAAKNSTGLSPDSAPQKGLDFQQTGDGLQEEEAEERTILMSRWASGDDSPQHMSDGECTPDMGRVSSPESGEFHREGSSGDRARVSSSDEEGCYTGSGSRGKCSVRDSSDGYYMDSDGENGEDAGANQVCFDSEDDGEDCQIEKPTESAHQQADMIPSCRNVFEYERLNKINEGTYGVVYKARDKKTGEIVALKKVKMDVRKDDGFPLTSLREINILSSFSHPSVVDVKEVVMDDFDGVYMVMEYVEHDLKALMDKMKGPFSIGEVKWLTLQLLEGVQYLHDNWVLHRDLKTSNLLLSKEGRLKICDFGLSRQYGSPRKPYTPLVVTLWYRAPELLLGTKEYSTAIDMWSVGCIMAELVAKSPLFSGKTEVEQLDKIFRTLGTPNESIWPGFSKLPGSKANFVKKQFNSLRQKFPPASFIGFPVLSDLGFDLLSRLLTYDPEKRITAEDALNHKWFVEAPLPRSDFRPSLPVVQGQNRYLGSWQ